MAERQLVYLDESGDPGLATQAGASPTFAVVAVVFASPADAETTADAVQAYRARLGKGENFTFHFADMKRAWREGFVDAVRNCPFRVRAVVVEKHRLPPGLRLSRSPAELELHALRLLRLGELAEVGAVKLFMDGRHQTRWLRANLRGVGPVRFATKRNPLAQLADVLAGAVARLHDPGRADSEYYQTTLRERLDAVRVIPPR